MGCPRVLWHERLVPRLLSLGKFCIGLAAAWGCGRRQEPPGVRAEPEPRVVIAVAATSAPPTNRAVRPSTATSNAEEANAVTSDSLPNAVVPGSLEDNLPFEPTGLKVASIAWRTWIYTDVGPSRTRYGYLRAGAVVDRRDPLITNAGCQGGWTRVNPRGFVCLGKGATLDLDHPVVVASQRRARRNAGLPYIYALSDQRAPHLYFRLPNKQQMRTVEDDYEGRAQRWLDARRARRQLELLDVAPEPPGFLLTGPLTKPYGVDSGLRHLVHAGQASSDSGFALLSTFHWEGRVFGLTTELDLIAMDRTRLVEPSTLTGVALEEDQDLPVALVSDGWLTRYVRSESGALVADGGLPKRTLIKVESEKQRIGGVGYWQTPDGALIPAAGVRLLERRSSFPSVATGTRKWIDVSIKDQTLVAYVGQRAVFATLVSTGAGGLGNPDKVPATVQGTFMVHTKHVAETMDGDDDPQSDSFNLRDVPFVQYFHKGYALHGAYWHDQFGRWRSHGCINLAPNDAAWLFEWTDPSVPEDWHGVINKERGTVVHIRP